MSFIFPREQAGDQEREIVEQDGVLIVRPAQRNLFQTIQQQSKLSLIQLDAEHEKLTLSQLLHHLHRLMNFLESGKLVDLATMVLIHTAADELIAEFKLRAPRFPMDPEMPFWRRALAWFVWVYGRMSTSISISGSPSMPAFEFLKRSPLLHLQDGCTRAEMKAALAHHTYLAAVSKQCWCGSGATIKRMLRDGRFEFRLLELNHKEADAIRSLTITLEQPCPLEFQLQGAGELFTAIAEPNKTLRVIEPPNLLALGQPLILTLRGPLNVLSAAVCRVEAELAVVSSFTIPHCFGETTQGTRLSSDKNGIKRDPQCFCSRFQGTSWGRAVFFFVVYGAS